MQSVPHLVLLSDDFYHAELRGPLREWAEALLAPDRLRRDGYLDPRVVARLWEQHQKGWRDHHIVLWSLLESPENVPEPPETDCSIIVTNEASTDIFLRAVTEVRSR